MRPDIRERLAREDVLWLLSTAQGRRFLFRILSTSGIWLPAYGTEDRHLAYGEGRRSLGLEVLGWINQVDPRGFLKVLEQDLQSQKEPVHERDDDD
jgi:hypothetical protein